jgi:hypothetical protein
MSCTTNEYHEQEFLYPPLLQLGALAQELQHLPQLMKSNEGGLPGSEDGDMLE